MLQVSPGGAGEVVTALHDVAAVLAIRLGGRVERDNLLRVGRNALPLAPALVKEVSWERWIVPGFGLTEQGPAVLGAPGRVENWTREIVQEHGQHLGLAVQDQREG